MSGNIEIVNGIQLETFRQKGRPRRPTSFQYSARLNAEMATEVDKLAATHGVRPPDIIRSALSYFFRNIQTPENEKSVEQFADRSAPAAPNPQLAPRWRGNGRSDLATAKRVNKANQDRKADGRAGERLLDKQPVR